MIRIIVPIRVIHKTTDGRLGWYYSAGICADKYQGEPDHKKTTGESAPVSAVLYSAWTFLSSYALIVKLRVLIKTRPLTSAQGRPYCEATSKNRKPCAADTAHGFRHDTPAESETLISLCRSVRWYIRSRILLPPGNTPHITNKRPHTHKNMISGNPPVRSSI